MYPEKRAFLYADYIIFVVIKMNRCKILKNVRLRAGLSQLQLAEKLGVDDTTISAYERGRTRPTINTILEIFEICHCKIFFEMNRKTITLQEMERDY